MTLLAGFKIGDIPILIGDFRISFFDSSYAGVRKKLLIINDNLAIGWTGSVAYAELAIKHIIEESYSGPPLTSDRLIDILGRIPEPLDESGNLVLVGWLIDGEPTPFRWSSRTPYRISDSLPIYEGSGRQFCAEVLGQDGPKIPEQEIKEQKGREIFLAAIIGNLMRIEQFYSGEKKDKDFGYAYECIIYENQKFSYLTNLTFFEVNATFSKEAKCTGLTLGDVVVSYIANDTISMLASTSQAKSDTRIDLIYAPGFDVSSLNKKWLNEQVIHYKKNILETKIFFFIIKIWIEGNLFIDNFILPLQSEDASLIVQRSEGGYSVSLSEEMLEWAFNTVMEHQLKGKENCQFNDNGWLTGVSMKMSF